MPLRQDDPSLDYGGSWADASQGWPELELPSRAHAEYAHYVAWRFAKVPYGSYVLVDSVLRLETRQYVKQVREALKKHPFMSDWRSRIKS